MTDELTRGSAGAYQMLPRARYTLGQIVNHKLFHYRGVIVGVDPVFRGTDAWYERMAKSRPNKDAPWYNVLVDGASHQTYVAEQNLEVDDSEDPIEHPQVELFFDRFEDGWYYSDRMVH